MVEALETIVQLIIGVVATLIVIYRKEIISIVKNISNLDIDTRKCGIIGIYENRYTSKAIEAMKREIKRADREILLVGVGFPSIFRPGTDFMEVIEEKLNDSTITFKILFLDPEKECAKERAEREKGDFTIKDIENSIEFLKKVSTKASLTVHTYNIPPIVYGIITDKCMFVEQYLYALPRTDMACMGGQVPFIKCKRDSNFYRVMKQHFAYMWNNKSKEIICRGEKLP